MDPNNGPNQAYWFVLREDQGNVIFSSNNITTIQNSQIPTDQEPRYIIDTSNRHYVPIAEQPAVQDDSESDKGTNKHHKAKDEEVFWDRNKVKLLLTLCLENKNVDKDTLWDEISSIIGVSPEDCHTKYRHLRRTYLRLLKKKRMGKDIKWVHYNICEEVFMDLRALPPSVLEPWEDNKVRQLLGLYIDNLQRFRNPNCLQKDIWREIATELGTTGYNCYHKFKNLRRSYLNWLNRSRETGKGIKWPYHQYFERIYYNYNPNTRPWDRVKIKLLLESYAQIAHKFRNPKLQKKELWKDISRKVGESPSACDKKFRNLKQTYVRLKMKSSSGRPTTKWRFFRDFETIYSNSTRYINIDGTQKIIYKATHEEDYIQHLLEFYLAHKDRFKDPLTKNRSLWKMIAPKLGLTPEACDKKFRNLKQTYIRLAWKKKQTGKCSKWPYFSYFDKIYENSAVTDGEPARRTELDDAVRCEIRRVLHDAHARREGDRRFERLASLAEESNVIQRERNRILQALLDRK
ncbi:uncharacterized protein LOC126377077 [Pectinophora gossypiella]|uniref:MADF domain-containing protein n=1 Tax=Pectinophora gossypiella TaxID=13191 RepID=A0A1E1WGM1_PECGO|nr:uncharacterized protein LOC126377077 [Pectinophora gossypiella]